MTSTWHRFVRMCTLAGILAILGSPVFAAGSVKINGERVEYPDGATLSALAPNLLAVTDAYWPAARIRNDRSLLAANALKQRVLTQLQSLGARAAGIEQLRRAVERFNPFGALEQSLDPDAIRLHRQDLRLAGDYEVVAPPRPDHVSVFGMTGQASRAPIGNGPVGSFSIDPDARLDGADRAWVYLIDPRGSVRRTGLSAFNARHLDVLPGSTIFVPVDPGLLDDSTRALNDDIVKLLAGGEATSHE